MRNTLTLLLFFMLLGHIGWAKKVDFYVPPIMKFKLDPNQWVLPYSTPYAYCAPTFDQSGTTVIKHLESNLNFTFSCKYDQDNLTYFDGKSLMKQLPAIEHFDIYKSTYGEADRMFLVNNSVASMTLFIEINVNPTSTEWREVAEKLLSSLEYVEPSEIDKIVGYPFEDPNPPMNILQERLAWKNKNKPSTNNYGSRYGDAANEAKIREQSKIMMDYTVGFNYAAYHTARVRMTNNQITSDEKAAYAFGFCPTTPGLMMVDSMSASYSQTKLGEQYMRDLIRAFYTADSFKMKNAIRIVSKKNGHWWLLTNDAQFSICFASLDENKKLRFQHHVGESETWVISGKLWKKEPPASYDSFTMTYKLPPYEILGNSGQLLKWQLPSTTPTPNGLVTNGVRTYFIDLTRPDAEMLVMEPTVDLAAYDLVYMDAGKKRNINSYSNENCVIYDKSNNLYNWFFRHSKFNQLQRYGDVYIDFKSEKDQRAYYAKALDATPQKTLVVSSLLRTDIDYTHFSLSRLYVSNGEIIRCESIAWNPEGMVKQVYEKEMPSQIADHEWTKDILHKSKGNFTNSYIESLTWKNRSMRDYDGGQTQRVCEVKNYDPVLITPATGDISYFTISKSEMHRLMSSVKYPADAKRKNIGGVVTVTTTVDRNGRILSVKANNTIPGAASLSVEAERLVKSLQTLDKGTKTPSGQTSVLISIRFAP